MMQVEQLTGFKSYRAMLAYNTLMLGLKMLPAYMGESYEEFFNRLEKLDDDGKATMIRSAIKFVPLDEPEMMALLCFCKDANGVPYRPENMKNLDPKQLMDVIFSVCWEISKIRVDFLGDTEKKNLKTSRSTSAKSS